MMYQHRGLCVSIERFSKFYYPQIVEIVEFVKVEKNHALFTAN